MPRFLADENIPVSVVRWLREKGFDVIRIPEIGLKGASDEKVIDYARKENRIILTLDLDFAYMYNFSRDFTVVVVRARPATPENIKTLLEKALVKIDFSRLEKGLIIISRKIRIII
ncbi:MAG: hypothetical protein DRJ51_09185 [Thermoprotei archaeon]|nr:MAG: hypothetical protein DRJ51_09185 [Thermoprotei archaeon]RLF01241.1 MAG: hypothetical protein DRJ59_06500 [Thermoprotei archaeon]